MSGTDRRSFLSLAGAAVGGVLLGGCGGGSAPGNAKSSAVEQTTTAIKPNLNGSLYAFGTDGHLFPGYTGQDHNHVSVLTSIDIKSGKSKQTPLPMGQGHSAMGLGDGRILCVAHHDSKSMLVSDNHKEIASFISPDNYVYGGHGLVLPEHGVFLMCMRNKNPKTLTDHGRFEIYDLKTLKLVERIDSGGLHPHEIHVIPGTDELIVTHYGDIYTPNPPYAHHVIEPKLTVYDAKTFKVKRHFVQDYNALLTHMSVSKDGYAYFVLTQYIEEAGWKKSRSKHLQAAPAGEEVSMEMSREMAPKPQESMPGVKTADIVLSELEKKMESITGCKRDYPIPYEAARELKLPVPLPFVRVNTKTGERDVFMTGDGNHLRSQSVGYNTSTDTALGIYYHADTAILHRNGGQPEVLSAGEVGLSEMRGVADIPGTSYVGLVAAHRGLVIYDLAKKEVVQRFPYQYFDTVHLSYDPIV
ncbi:MAG: DUF1513 domain-containing protein [Candidatus Obscuribacterales bacterium]|nr:DUF1513 domain-containing protein [Candidatus Obscuribacterales bacterium]